MREQPAELATTVSGGNRRAALEAIRDRLAFELDAAAAGHIAGCECECGPLAGDGRIVVQLTKELRTTIAELDALPVGKGVSSVDEVAQRRNARRQANAASQPVS